MTAAVHGHEHRGPLSRLREFVTRRPGFLRNIIVLLVTAVLGLTILAIFVAQEDIILPWQNKTTYFADFSDASSIAPGQHQEIRVAGVHVGDIGTGSISNGGKAHVQLLITSKHVTIYQNAHALLQAKTPLNEMYIELNPGSPSAPVLKPGGTIPLAQTNSPIEVDQILQHLGPNFQTGARVVLEQTNAALVDASDYLPSDLSSLNGTMTSLQPVAAAVATRQAELRTLISDLTRIAQVAGGNQGRLASILNTADSTLRTLQANDGALSQTLSDLPGTTQALGTALPKVEGLAGQLNPLLDHVRASSTILPNALDHLNTTLKNLDPLLNVLRPVIADGNPLVSDTRNYLVSANPSLGVLDQIGPDLKPLTSYVAYDMPWLNGFFFNTNSLTSVQTGNNTQVRSLVVLGGGSGTGLCSDLANSIGKLTGTAQYAAQVGQGICKAFNLTGGK